MEMDETARSVPMKVLALGLSRSGTMSMKVALEELGMGPVYHGLSMFGNIPHTYAWHELGLRKYPPSSLRGQQRGGQGQQQQQQQQRQPNITRADLDPILGSFAAVTDMPCAAFWRELMDAYPSARIVLVQRDLEAWFASFDAIVVGGLYSAKARFLVGLAQLGLIPVSSAWALYPIFYGKFRARNPREVAAHARQVYLEHYAAVRAYAREKGMPVLEYQLGQGWEPLCEFLQVPVPDKPFPKTHERTWMVDMIEQAQTGLFFRLFIVPVATGAGVVAAVAIGFGVLRQPRWWRSMVGWVQQLRS